MTILLSGDILLTGFGTYAVPGNATQQQLLLAEYTSTGKLDPTFGANGLIAPPIPLSTYGSSVGSSISMLSSGTVTVTGGVSASGSTSLFVAEYNLNPQVTTYCYDLRNKLTSVSLNGAMQATYVYDDSQNRVQETADGTTTLYLTDTANPTGYPQPVEAKTSGATTLSMTYIIGDRVTGQADQDGNISYLLIDGHGSTRLITDSSGTATNTLNYDAFGGAINFSPGSAGTKFLFGGDAIYDPVSGLYMHGDGVRPRMGFAFIQRDTLGHGNNADPLSLHTYLYAEADPTDGADPSGHDRYVVSGGNGHHGIAVDTWAMVKGKWVKTGTVQYDFSADWSYWYLLAGAMVGVPGRVTGPSNVFETVIQTFPSSPQADLALKGNMDADVINPPIYNVFFYNCNDFVMFHIMDGIQVQKGMEKHWDDPNDEFPIMPMT